MGLLLLHKSLNSSCYLASAAQSISPQGGQGKRKRNFVEDEESEGKSLQCAKCPSLRLYSHSAPTGCVAANRVDRLYRYLNLTFVAFLVTNLAHDARRGLVQL